MKYFNLFITLALCVVNTVSAATLTRARIIAAPAGPIAFEGMTLTEALRAADRIAETNGIPLSVHKTVVEEGHNQKLSLHADGLSLDALLEFLTRSSGTEWNLSKNRIVVYPKAEQKAKHEARLNSAACKQLDRVIIPEIEFKNVSLVAAFHHVRAEAARVAGLSAVPKIDVPVPLTRNSTFTLAVKNASVLELFDLIMAVSVSSVDWKFQGARIVIFDEALRREYLRREREAAAKAPLIGGAGGGADIDFSFDGGFDDFGGGGGPYFRDGPNLPPGKEATPFNTESYDHFGDNPFYAPRHEPLSTFSVDVDTASYANVRRLIESGGHIPVDATRIEEFINYFNYNYAPPAVGPAGKPVDGPPFAAQFEVATAPWAPAHWLVRIGLKGYEVDWASRPPSNLVFLLDVSGSMERSSKLPLVKESLRFLIRRLDARDNVTLVVYAGASGLVLAPTTGDKTRKIRSAIENLEAGGSTNGGEGIELAYKLARQHFNPKGNNRVILCTDGDFNVGTTDRDSLVKQVEAGAKSGVYLTILGFGMGNLKDGMMETLSNKGNGNYGYIDSRREARKIFARSIDGTLITIAKDVKVQVEFNPAQVGAYRLIGYENRLLEAQDFDDDTKDAGDIGSGHTVTAFYEIVPPGKEADILRSVAPLKYQQVQTRPADPAAANELLTVKLRYKQPDQDRSELLSFPLTDSGQLFREASTDFQFTTAVAAFGMVLRDSDFRGSASVPLALEIARGALGDDPHNDRKQFVSLVEKYQQRSNRTE